MPNNMIRCCLLGGQERDLFVLGELHKQPHIEVAFVFDRDPGAVGLEIAEILGIPRLTATKDIESYTDIEYVVVSEPRRSFQNELDILTRAGAKTLSRSEATRVLCGEERVARVDTPAVEAPVSENFSIEDALSAFEKLFDRKELLKFLLDVGVRAVGASAGSIMMYSEESEDLYIAYATGLSERVIQKTRQKLGEGIAGTVARERKGQLIREAHERSLYPHDRDRVDVKSAISVPLLWESRLLGVLNVSSGAGDSQLDESGLASLQKLSARISRVLNESLKLQATQLRHQEMHLRHSMGEISEKQVSANVKFSLISNLLGELVDAETVEIYFGTHEGDWLVLGGSNRRLAAQPDLIRCEKGALSRAYLERETIVFTESSKTGAGEKESVSSFAFVPLYLKESLGVLTLEFCDPHKLDEFLWIKDSIVLELSRFVASEKREKNLRKEVSALNRVSEAAPTLLTRHSLEDLCDFVARLTADVLNAERVSVRIRGSDRERGKVARLETGQGSSEKWIDEDEQRFAKLNKKREPFALAFLTFAPEAGEQLPPYHSLLAMPIKSDDRFYGGVIAYDKRASSPLDEATFSDLDRTILQHIVSLTIPAIRLFTHPVETTRAAEEPSYDAIVRGNLQRFHGIIENEMSRSDRYHHSFSLLVLKLKPLESFFESDYQQALSLVEEITRGIQTRTRKTDFGCWIGRATFAMISLEGTKRIKFLISRLMQYLLKDFTSVSGRAVEPRDIFVGLGVYPGASKTPQALIDEVEKNLKPYQREN